MTISISLSTSKLASQQIRFYPYPTDDLEHLARIICLVPWSTALLRDNYRRNENFIESHYLALDFDDGWPIESAIGTCRANDLTHIVATTKSHRIPKGEQGACDRYRVILRLERPVTTVDEFYATWFEAWKMFGRKADRSAKDPSRCWWPCREIRSVTEDQPLAISTHAVRTNEDVRSIVVRGATSTAIKEMLQLVSVPGKRAISVFRVSQMCAAAKWGKDDTFLVIKEAKCDMKDKEIKRVINNGFDFINGGGGNA